MSYETVTTVKNRVTMPLCVARNLDIALCENGYTRSEQNRQELWAGIKKTLPGVSDANIEKMAKKDILYLKDNGYTRALSDSFRDCENSHRLEIGKDMLPGDCYESNSMIDPEFPWPASNPEPAVPYPYDPD